MKLCTAFFLALSAAFAGAPAAIGVVSASGYFDLEGSRIWGNSTLFEGADVQTTEASSELALPNGVKVHLAAHSAVRVWKDRIELTRGSGQVLAPATFTVRTGAVSVEGTRYRVGLHPDARLEVTSLAGSARVLSSNRTLLATVPAGRNLTFAMQQPMTRSGCLLYKGNGFILQVDDSPEVLQLTGPSLAQNLGNRVQVTGVPSAAPATISPAATILNVSELTLRAPGGCLTAASNLSAQTSMPAVPSPAPQTAAAQPTAPPAEATIARSGLSTGAKVGIVGAIAGGGAGAALALSGKKKSTSP